MLELQRRYRRPIALVNLRLGFKAIISAQYIHKAPHFIRQCGSADFLHRGTARGTCRRVAVEHHDFCRLILFPGDVAPPSFQRRRITAQHVSFGEQPNDAPIEEGIHHDQRFGLGAVEGKDRLLHRHFRQQHFI